MYHFIEWLREDYVEDVETNSHVKSTQKNLLCWLNET